MNDQLLRTIMIQIIDELGYGLKESVYQCALAVELRFQGHKVDLEVNKSILYRGSQACHLHNVGTVRLDMVIDDNFIVELKALAKITKKEFTQLQQYIKISGINNGCIINVNTDSVQVLTAAPL
jgi:GxxExxY protein